MKNTNRSPFSIIAVILIAVAAFFIGRSSYTVQQEPERVTAATYNTEQNQVQQPEEPQRSYKPVTQKNQKPTVEEVRDYVLNISSHKIHLPDCNSVSQMKDTNKDYVHDSIQNIIEADNRYSTCGNCLRGVE